MTFLGKARSGSTRAALLLSACIVMPAAGFAQQPVAPPSYDKPPVATTEAPAAKQDESAAKTTEPSSKSGDEAKGGDDARGNDTKTAGTAKDRHASNHEAFFDARLAALHAGLTLTDDQETLWPPVETAIRDFEKTRISRASRAEIESLLRKSPSDLLRMRSEQLTRRGEAMKKLADATGPLVDKLDDAQKRRLPLLLDGMRPAHILRAAFDIRFGRVVDDPDDDATPKASSQREDRGSDDSDEGFENGMHRRHRPMHDQSYGRGYDEREGAAYDDGRGNPMAMQGPRAAPADD